MTDQSFEEQDEAPTIEVRIWRHGQLVHTELCESDEQASLIVEAWEQMDGVRSAVDDLSVRHHPGDILDGEPPEPGAEDYEDRSAWDRGAASKYED